MPAPPRVDTRLADLQRAVGRLAAVRAATNPRVIFDVNELVLVRLTLAWEEFLEQTFICYLRGASGLNGTFYPLTAVTPPPGNSSTALQVAINAQPYGKWLDESWARQRAAALFAGQGPYGPALSSAFLPELRRVRNRIVHRSDKAKQEFNLVVQSTLGSRRPAMTPGRFLEMNTSGSPRIDSYLANIAALGSQIAS